MEDIMPKSATRGWFLTAMAVLFLVLAFSDFTKAVQFKNNPAMGGLVVFGHKFVGVGANAIGGPLFALILLAYAFGLWKLRPWTIPLSVIYAFYVPVNMVMFWSLHQLPPPGVNFIVMYLAIALTGSIGTALYIGYHKEKFRS
jgi:hypothetical protein